MYILHIHIHLYIHLHLHIYIYIYIYIHIAQAGKGPEEGGLRRSRPRRVRQRPAGLVLYIGMYVYIYIYILILILLLYIGSIRYLYSTLISITNVNTYIGTYTNTGPTRRLPSSGRGEKETRRSAGGDSVGRGKLSSNTTCLTHGFFKLGE